MNPQLMPARDVVLVGAGHTNLHIVRMWRMQAIPDVRLTLISPFGKATYSGMLPGSLAELYRPHEMEIDLFRLSMSCGVRLIIDEVIGCESEGKQFLLKNRPPVRFDAASIGIGSIPGQRDIWKDLPDVLSIKPMATFRERLQERINVKIPLTAPLRIGVVGAGAAGVEVSLCLNAWLNQHAIRGDVSLIDGGAEILKGYLAGTRRRVVKEFSERNMTIHTGKRVSGHRDGHLICEDGSRIPTDIVIWATAAAPPPVFADFDLPKAPDGFLAVRPTLQTTAEHPIFVVGDSASFLNQTVPKAGVYAVREAPVLWQNLRNLLAGHPLTSYHPQKEFLSILALGDGRAVMQHHGFSAKGKWVWYLKDRIDRAFMRKYQAYEPPRSMPTASSSAKNVPMRCTGCGGKAGAGVLEAALERLGSGVATLRRDDAVVLREGEHVNVLSVDFFQSFLDDPYLVGRVAALNALSDIWAMGCHPKGALAIVGVPAGTADQQTEALFQLLAGGLRELRAAGAELWGGHTIETDQLLVGYSVTGHTADHSVWTKGGLRPGDRLVLTKPLGTGTLLAAHQQAECQSDWMEQMLAGMLTSQETAVNVLRQYSVRGVTDVTGFGLGGHLREMLEASRVSARLKTDQIPLLPGFEELAEREFESSLAAANRDTLNVILEPIDVNAGNDLVVARQALVDPQTHGGLLCGVPAQEAQVLVEALRNAGMVDASEIGEIFDASPVRLTIE